MKREAFTLAEVLITIGIIGVIAAMTIPTLMQKTNRKETVAAVKKSYSVLSNALKLAEAQHGNITKWDGSQTVASEYSAEEYEKYGLTDSDWVGYMYLFDNLKVVKACGIQSGCFVGNDVYPNDTVTYLNGSREETYPLYYSRKAILADGFSVAITRKDKVIGNFIPPPNSHLNKYIYSFFIYVDVNGTKGPNRIGYDQFLFTTDENGSLNGRDSFNFAGSGTGLCNLEDNGYSCAQYIMENDNMNYLDE